MTNPIIEAYRSGRVIRYHCNPDMSEWPQQNSNHQWGCAVLLLMLYPEASKELLAQTLMHDAEELVGGDLHHDFKRKHPEFAAEHVRICQEGLRELGIPQWSLTPEEQRWLKFVDRLESLFYMHYRGVTWHAENYKEIRTRARDLGINSKLIEEIIDYVREQ